MKAVGRSVGWEAKFCLWTVLDRESEEEEVEGLREVGRDNKKKAAAAVVVVLLIACRPQNSRKFHKPRGRKF